VHVSSMFLCYDYMFSIEIIFSLVKIVEGISIKGA